MSESVPPPEWIVIDRALYDYVTGRRPPRPFALWRQLWHDVRDPRRIGLWPVAAAMVLAGWWAGSVIPAVAAVVPVGLYFHGLYGGMRCRRSAPVKTGTLTVLDSGTALWGFHSAEVNMGGVAVRLRLPLAPLAPLIAAKSDVEVMFLYDAGGENSAALAVRVAEGRPIDLSGRAAVPPRRSAGEYRIAGQRLGVTPDGPPRKTESDESRPPESPEGDVRPEVNPPSPP